MAAAMGGKDDMSEKAMTHKRYVPGRIVLKVLSLKIFLFSIEPR